MVLSRQQIAEFKREGFLILPGFIPSDLLQSWRATFWQSIDASPDDPSSWPGNYKIFDPKEQPAQKNVPFRLSDFPPMVEIADQLMGEGIWRRGLRPPNPDFSETESSKEDDLMQVKWPEPGRSGKPWEPPMGGHVEGGNTNKGGWKGGFMMGAITCLEDVPHGGGCFYFWPKSHTAIHSFFKEKPEFINPNQFPHPFNTDTESLDRETPTGYDFQPREWQAKAGDCIIWHHWLMHNGSPNVSNVPRLGLFARWHHKDWKEMRYDKGGITSDGDLWKYLLRPTYIESKGRVQAQ